MWCSLPALAQEAVFKQSSPTALPEGGRLLSSPETSEAWIAVPWFLSKSPWRGHSVNKYSLRTSVCQILCLELEVQWWGKQLCSIKYLTSRVNATCHVASLRWRRAEEMFIFCRKQLSMYSYISVCIIYLPSFPHLPSSLPSLLFFLPPFLLFPLTPPCTRASWFLLAKYCTADLRIKSKGFHG